MAGHGSGKFLSLIRVLSMTSGAVYDDRNLNSDVMHKAVCMESLHKRDKEHEFDKSKLSMIKNQSDKISYH